MAKPAFKYRGVMLDLARLTERHDYYLQLLPQLKEWGYNVIHVHFTDDQGCALEFPSHPELATPHAFTADEMRRFCAEARGNGLEVIPEIECFGHTGFITRVKKYRHLNEIDQGPSRFGGMCVFLPESQAILKDLLRDTMDIFQPRIIHAGLDEVNFGYHAATKRLLKKKSQHELFADHINWCHKIITGMGARMGIWGDHLLPDLDEESVIARRTPKDTVIFDWHYEAGYQPKSLDFFVERGFEVIGCPATQRSANRVMSSWENFDNLQLFSGYALQRRQGGKGKGKVTGMVVTVWCPYRYIPGTIEYPLAVAGRLLESEDMLPEAFATDFAAQFWGLKGRPAADAGFAVHSLHMAGPTAAEYERILFGAEMRRTRAAFSRADQSLSCERLEIVQEAGRALQSVLPKVRRNRERVEDLLVGAEYLWNLYAFGVSGRTATLDWKGLRKNMQKSWARTRYTDGIHFTGGSVRFPADRVERDCIMRHVNQLAK